MGITVLRHFKDLMQLFQFHLEIGHLPNLPFVLRAIETVISVAWIRYDTSYDSVLLNLSIKIKIFIAIRKYS